MEMTYGYNPLAILRYSRYLEAASKNPRLLDSLSVTAKLDLKEGLFMASPSALPRISVPASVVPSGRLEELDPAKTAIVEGSAATSRNGPVELSSTRYEGSLYGARYRAEQPAVLRLAVPFFPGWRAEVDGQDQPVFALDGALTGVRVPAGSHDIVFRYRPNWFTAGAAISAVGWLGVICWILMTSRRQRSQQAAVPAA